MASDISVSPARLVIAGAAFAGAGIARQNEQFFPVLVVPHRAYAPNGMPFANGFADY